jgi:hypothetical protein
MQRSGKIILVADVTKLVRNNGFYLWRRQMVEYALGQQEYGPENTKDPWLQQSGGGHCPDRYFQPQGGPATHGKSDTSPANPPRAGDPDESKCPAGQ